MSYKLSHLNIYDNLKTDAKIDFYSKYSNFIIFYIHKNTHISLNT